MRCHNLGGTFFGGFSLEGKRACLWDVKSNPEKGQNYPTATYLKDLVGRCGQ